MMSEGEEGNAWIFPRQFIDSIQKDKKTKLSRSKTIWFIQDAGRALSLDHVVKSTAAVFFHRFYLFHGFEQHDRFLVALACLFLAAKVEERAVKVKDLVHVYFDIYHQKPPTDRDVQMYSKDIILKERILLNTLNFEFVVVHPFEFCQRKVIEVKSFIQHDVKEFLASMYAIINDTYRTTLCLQYLPSQIAMAVFYIASIQLSIKPATHSSNRSGSHDKTWLDLLEQDIDPSLLHEIALEILDFYDQKTNIISERDRILSSIIGSNIHTVSNSNTPNFTVDNPLVDGKEQLGRKEFLQETITQSIVEESFAEPVVATDLGFCSRTGSCHAHGSVSPQSVHPPILDGSESTQSTFGFATMDSRHHNTIDSTPSWTPHCDEVRFRRDRSNSLNEYTSVDIKRYRCE